MALNRSTDELERDSSEGRSAHSVSTSVQIPNPHEKLGVVVHLPGNTTGALGLGRPSWKIAGAWETFSSGPDSVREPVSKECDGERENRALDVLL